MPNQIAASMEIVTSAPVIAEPIGKPMKLSAPDTTITRPIHAGSVRRWRIVNSPMSRGPFIRPKTARAKKTSGSPASGSSNATPMVESRTDHAMMARSRPSVRNRPNANAAIPPAAPESAQARPTWIGPAPYRPWMMTGITIAVMPPAKLMRVMVNARPRSVGSRAT